MGGRRIRSTWRHDPALYAPARYRRACSYEAFVPDKLADLEFSLHARTAGVVSEAERAIRELNTTAQPALAPLARLLLRTESIASSKVEGMRLDVRDLARAESRAQTGHKVGRTALEVLGNIDAMQVAVDEASIAEHFTAGHIVTIHRHLMANAPNSGIAGVIRTGQNWIGGNDYNPCGADFVPPPPEYMRELLKDLCDAINGDELPPVVQAALVHAQFETIHPFDDGNGRTGRALIHVVLHRRGLAPDYVPPISVVLAAERERYITGLDRYREDELDRWVEQFATAAARSAQLAAAYIRAMGDQVEKWRARLASAFNPRADAAAWAVIDVLPAHPIITTPVAARATGRAKSAIHNAFSELERAGVLQALSVTKRNRSWEAVGMLDLIADLEAARLPPRLSSE